MNFALSGVTVLLSLTVFQQSISDAMPVTSLQIPLLGNCLVKYALLVVLQGRLTINLKQPVQIQQPFERLQIIHYHSNQNFCIDCH